MSGLLWQCWPASGGGYWAQRYWGRADRRGPQQFPDLAQATEWATPPRYR